MRGIQAHLRRHAIAYAALFVALGGTSLAAFDPIGMDGDVDACYAKKSGDLDLRKGKSCNRGEKPVTWSQAGPPGSVGPEGPQGEPATRLWAVVSSAGSLLRGSGAVSAATVPAGYEVIFDRDVSNCSYSATLGAASAEDGEVGVGPRNNQPNGVFVLTSNSAGADTPHGFNLQVFC